MLPVSHLLEKYPDSPYIVLSDFDGTVTECDSNDHLIDGYGMGVEKRKVLWKKVVEETETFRDAFKVSLESAAVNVTFPEAVSILRKAIKLDPGFLPFYQWCREQSPPIPVIVVSSGMEPIIRGILAELIGEQEAADIDIVANDVELGEGPHDWDIVFRHPESGFGHDKSLAILPFKNLPHKPTLFFCGDGISDMSAARHAHVLFVKNKEGNDLKIYCENNGLPFKLFNDFTTVLEEVKAVVDGEKTPEQVMA